MDIGIIGNIAIDRYILNPEDIKSAKNWLKVRGIVLEKSRKSIVPDIELLTKELNFPSILRLGGGGHNSLEAALKFPLTNRYNYYDVSCRPSFGLSRDVRVNYYFGSAPIAHALILEENEDRAIGKTERFDKDYQPSERELKALEMLLQSPILLVNSIANPPLARIIGQTYQGRKYIVVTKNLGLSELESSRLLQDSTAIIDIEESDILMGKGSQKIEKTPESIQYAIGRLMQLGSKRAIVTLGRDGAAYFENNMGWIDIARIKDGVERLEVQPYLKNFGVKKNCAGDYFAAGLLHFLEAGQDFAGAMVSSQAFVVRKRFGYPVRETDYITQNIPK